MWLATGMQKNAGDIYCVSAVRYIVNWNTESTANIEAIR